MYEINVADIKTDDRDFPVAKQAILERYSRIYEQYMPDGHFVRRCSVSQQELVASAYTAIIMSHTQTVAIAFDKGLYASGFALVRPTLEALIKQAMLGAYEGDGDDWKKLPDRRVHVTRAHLKELAARSGFTVIEPLWHGLAPWLNDFVHGGKGQLTSNPVNDEGWPQYPGAWFWSAMLAVEMSVLITSAWFWNHFGYQERCDAIQNAVTNVDWGTVMTVRNGQEIRIVARESRE